MCLNKENRFIIILSCLLLIGNSCFGQADFYRDIFKLKDSLSQRKVSVNNGIKTVNYLEYSEKESDTIIYGYDVFNENNELVQRQRLDQESGFSFYIRNEGVNNCITKLSFGVEGIYGQSFSYYENGQLNETFQLNSNAKLEGMYYKFDSLGNIFEKSIYVNGLVNNRVYPKVTITSDNISSFIYSSNIPLELLFHHLNDREDPLLVLAEELPNDWLSCEDLEYLSLKLSSEKMIEPLRHQYSKATGKISEKDMALTLISWFFKGELRKELSIEAAEELITNEKCQ